MARPVGAVAPGLHRPQAGEHRVVWWDPSVLRLGVQESVGLAQQKLLTSDESGARSEQGVRAHAEWQAERAQLREQAGAPSVRVATATELAVRFVDGSFTGRMGVDAISQTVAMALRLTESVMVEDTAAPRAPRKFPKHRAATADQPMDKAADDVLPLAQMPDAPGEAGRSADQAAGESPAPDEGPRPRGPRFGTLVHAVLASVDLDAARLDVQALAELHGRLLGASAEEVTGAVDAAARALAHPLLRRAASAAREGRCRRETPVTARLEDGSLIEGVVDAAFLEDGAWTVVDFKTDADVAGRLDEYRRQVALYAWAIAQATGLPARGVLLRV